MQIIETLKSKINSQQDFLAQALSDAARQYYDDDWDCHVVVSDTVACPIYYQSYLEGMSESRIQEIPPDIEDDINTGYMHVPRNTIDTLAYRVELFREYLLFVDRLIRLEDYMRINDITDESLTKKIERNLTIVSEVISLCSDVTKSQLLELLSKPNPVIFDKFLLAYVREALESSASKEKVC